MTDTNADPHVSLRRSVYSILIVIGLGMVLGRILAVDAVDRTAVQADRAKRVDQDVDRERKLLQATGVQGQELDDSLAAVQGETSCPPIASASVLERQRSQPLVHRPGPGRARDARGRGALRHR